MEIIDLNEYNIQYEIQYIDLMIRFLNPFIRFKFNKDGELDIFKKGSGSLIEEKITTKEFINFIHYTFPEIVQKEVEKVDGEADEEFKKQVFLLNYEDNFQGRQCPRVKHSGMYDQCKTDTFNEYFEMFKKMSVEEIEEQKENYNIAGMNSLDTPSKQKSYTLKINYLSEKKRYFNTMSSKLMTINSVLQFLENLQYSNSM